MPIRNTYAEYLVEQIIREILAEGENPSSTEIEDRFDEFEETNDISKALFIAKNYLVAENTSSSSSLYNTTNSDVLRDLQVLYRHLFKVSDQSIKNFNRWRDESRLLETRLNNLEEKITSLLLLSEDTAGYFNFIQDNFVDTSKTDLTNSTAYVNIDKGIVQIGTSSIGATRVNLENLEDKDVEFYVLSKNNWKSKVEAEGSRPKYAVSDATNYYQERVYMNQPSPVTAELKILFGKEHEISRIDIDLHMSNTNSSVQITPMYSTDNYNWLQLPTDSFTRNLVDKSTFQFTPVTAKYVKFIMTKTGYDALQHNEYLYEFGMDEISFYNEGFTENTDVNFISQSLSVLDIDGQSDEFSKIALEICENIPAGTSISYFVTASTESTIPISTAIFTPIDPENRDNPTKPTVLDFGDLDTITIENIAPSYNSSYGSAPATEKFMNPDKSLTMVQSISGAAAVTASGLASEVRYSFYNNNDRILDHQMNPNNITIAQNTLELWRNVNTQGSTVKVRDYSNGWGFEDPYYKTTVYVDNPTGMDIDFGAKAAIIDEVGQPGKANIARGRHKVFIHKDNWKVIDTSGVANLDDLKTEDGLYPYNHRYLVEGFSYPSAYPEDDEEIYKGFDIVAEHFMKEVSVFDMIHNVPIDDYSKFAIDTDARDTGRTTDGVADTDEQGPMNVFLVKVNENNSDFMNEKYTMKFKSANTLYKYLRFKAVLQTTDPNITPELDSYRIKISS